MSKYSKEDTNALIDLIIWYRDDYHKTLGGPHNDMIDELQNFPSDEAFESIELVVDGWIDGSPYLGED